MSKDANPGWICPKQEKWELWWEIQEIQQERGERFIDSAPKWVSEHLDQLMRSMGEEKIESVNPITNYEP